MFSDLIAELKKVYCHQLCDNNCEYKSIFSKGKFVRKPIFITQYGKKCSSCEQKVSVNNHLVCHGCAKKYENPIEFSYHHKICEDDKKIYIKRS